MKKPTENFVDKIGEYVRCFGFIAIGVINACGDDFSREQLERNRELIADKARNACMASGAKSVICTIKKSEFDSQSEGGIVLDCSDIKVPSWAAEFLGDEDNDFGGCR